MKPITAAARRVIVVSAAIAALTYLVDIRLAIAASAAAVSLSVLALLAWHSAANDYTTRSTIDTSQQGGTTHMDIDAVDAAEALLASDKPISSGLLLAYRRAMQDLVDEYKTTANCLQAAIETIRERR